MLSNGALKFSRVTLGDAGTYQCLAKNDAGVAVGRTKLVLQGIVDHSSHPLVVPLLPVKIQMCVSIPYSTKDAS